MEKSQIGKERLKGGGHEGAFMWCCVFERYPERCRTHRSPERGDALVRGGCVLFVDSSLIWWSETLLIMAQT